MKVFLTIFLFITVVYGGSISMKKLQDFAKHVNSIKTTWEANENPLIHLPSVETNNLIDTFRFKPTNKKPHEDDDDEDEDEYDDDDDDEDDDDEDEYNDDDEDEDDDDEENERRLYCENNGLPTSFDSREQWPMCDSLKHIYDQGNCHSEWAIGPTSVFSDRICIASKGKIKIPRSIQQIVSCCDECVVGDGCYGGRPLEAFKYMITNGLVSGGDYHSHQGCQPYRIRPCNHYINGTLPRCETLPKKEAPKCKTRCYNSKYSSKYAEDNIKAKSFYLIDPCSAMNEIYTKGPIVATFAVYKDFITYKTGVYQHTKGHILGYNDVRVLGWGEENNVQYWLVANSWNNNWGNNGTFKMIRFENECYFEESFMSIEPDL